jgi:uncharacterized protein YqhQ
MAKKILVGGQAVIEGVMMRVPGAYATAVRRPDGEIEVRRETFSLSPSAFQFSKNRFYAV